MLQAVSLEQHFLSVPPPVEFLTRAKVIKLFWHSVQIHVTI